MVLGVAENRGEDKGEGAGTHGKGARGRAFCNLELKKRFFSFFFTNLPCLDFSTSNFKMTIYYVLLDKFCMCLHIIGRSGIFVYISLLFLIYLLISLVIIVLVFLLLWFIISIVIIIIIINVIVNSIVIAWLNLASLIIFFRKLGYLT